MDKRSDQSYVNSMEDTIFIFFGCSETIYSLDGARLSSFSFDLAKFSTSSIVKRLKFSAASFTSFKNLISDFATSKEETIFIFFGCNIHTT